MSCRVKEADIGAQILAGALRTAPEPALQCFEAEVKGRAVLDLLLSTLLEDSAPLDVRSEVEAFFPFTYSHLRCTASIH